MKYLLSLTLLHLILCVGFTQSRVIINPGFEETPPLDSTSTGTKYWTQFTDDKIPGWSTTGVTKEIEIWPSMMFGSPPPSKEGNHLAELNADDVAGLYQDICVLDGESFNWSLSHRGRNGVDVMRLVIDGVEQGMMSSGNNAWVDYNGVYTHTGGSRVVRFLFEAVSVGGAGNLSQGNFLDDIQITGFLGFPFFDANSFSTLESSNQSPQLFITGVVETPSKVIVRVTGGTASNGTDYTGSILDTVNVPVGTYDGSSLTSISMPFTIEDDNTVEGDETISFEILGVIGNLMLPNGACGMPLNNTSTNFTIIDDDCPGEETSICTLGDQVNFTYSHGTPSMVNWVDDINGNVLVTNNPSISYTPTSLPDTIYAQSLGSNTGVVVEVDHSGGYYHSTTGADKEYMRFDADNAFFLKSVEVKANCTSGTETRTITLYQNGVSTGQTSTFNVTCGSSSTIYDVVSLGWVIPQGTGYELRSSGGSMKVKYSTSQNTYPKSFASLVTLNGPVTDRYSSAFFNWEITPLQAVCHAPYIVTGGGSSPIQVTYPDTACSGEIIDISLTDAGVLFDWTITGAVSNTISGSNNINASIEAGVNDIDVTLIKGSGGVCSGDTSFTIVIDEVDVDVMSSQSTTICRGESLTLTASGAITYQWNNGITEVDNQITVQPLTTTTYQAVGVNAKGCKDFASITVTVNIPPTISLTALPTMICLGDSSLLTVSGANSYVWSNSLSISGNTQYVKPTAETTYKVIGTDNNSCKDTAEIQLIVNSLPDPTIVTTDEACAGSQMSFSTQTTFSTYDWANDFAAPTGSGSLYTVAVPNTNGASSHQVTVAVTDNNGCENTDSYLFEVLTTEIPILTHQSSSACESDAGLPVSFGSVTSGVEAGYTYAWYKGTVGNGDLSTEQLLVGNLNGNASTNINLTTSGLADGDFIYLKAERNLSTCASVVAFSTPTAIQIDETPTISGLQTETVVCLNDSFVLDVTVVGPSSINLDWKLDGVSTGYSSNQLTSSLSIAGSYNYSVEATNGKCIEEVETTVEVKEVNVTAHASTVWINQGESVDISATSSPNSIGYTYTWTTNPAGDDGDNVTAQSFTSTPQEPLIYTVKATISDVSNVTNNCSAYSEIAVNVVKQPIPDQVFSPGNGDEVNEYWRIENLNTAIYPNNVVRVYNRWGNVVFEGYGYDYDGTASPSLSEVKWNGTHNDIILPVATYYYVIELNDPDKTVLSGSISIIR